MPKETEIKPVKEFTIVRRRWRRGKGTEKKKSLLLNSEDNKMCCLGFYMEACGIPREELKDKGFPRNVIQPVDPATGIVQDTQPAVLRALRKADAGWLTHRKVSTGVVRDSESTSYLVDANDDTAATYEEIEKKVKTLFAEKGIRVKFK